MRFLFTTIQFEESDFYGRVAAELERHGNEVAHVCISRRAAADMQRRGFRSWCLPDEMAALGPYDVNGEVARIERDYPIPSLRDVYRVDPAVRGRSEAWCVERTVRHFLALEKVIAEFDPQVVVPEVGRETLREAAYLAGMRHGAPVFFLLNSIFPNPLRLTIDSYHTRLVPDDEVRPLTGPERREVEAFVREFIGRGKPILGHRRVKVTLSKLRDFARHIAVSTTQERDNDYLRPSRFVTSYFQQKGRELAVARLYEDLAERPFYYFPLHVTDDFKIERAIPHCADQESLIRQVADNLPQGYDLVLKEHPRSLGRNSPAMLRRLTRIPNVRLVDPYVNSHELIRRAEGIVVISSTVGIEALMYGKPVLTLGQPYFAGYGVTVDLDSFRHIRTAVPALREFEPDPERVLELLHAGMRTTLPGAPSWVSLSDENARDLGASLDRVGRSLGGRAELRRLH
ncbi:MAG TPA: hypothetical protein VF066_06815 [Thermoleophilaceae bacterium]